MAHTVVNGRIISDNVEVPVVNHCNLSCRGCNHLSPLARKAHVDPVRLAASLKALATCYRASMLRLVGGEPLLHPDITAVAEIAHSSKVAKTICLVTNGLLLERAPAQLWKFINRLEISAYGDFLTDTGAEAQIKKRMNDLGIALVVKHTARFREPYSTSMASNAGLTLRIYRTCQIAHRWGGHNVHDGHFYKCAQAHSLPEQVRIGAPYSDGVALHGAGLAHRLVAYLNSAEPLGTCSHCLGSAGKLFAHELIARTSWDAQQQRPFDELVDWEYLRRLEQEDPDPEWGVVERYERNGPNYLRRAIHKLRTLSL